MDLSPRAITWIKLVLRNSYASFSAEIFEINQKSADQRSSYFVSKLWIEKQGKKSLARSICSIKNIRRDGSATWLIFYDFQGSSTKSQLNDSSEGETSVPSRSCHELEYKKVNANKWAMRPSTSTNLYNFVWIFRHALTNLDLSSLGSF